MANRIFIQDYNREEDALDFPILDDITFELASQFGTFNDLVPKVGDILDMGTLVSASTGGTIDAGLLQTKNMFDIPTWKKTNAVKLLTRLVFHLKDDPKKNIFDPMTTLIGYSILTTNDVGQYIVPGISLATLKDFQQDSESKSALKNSKIISLSIPGVIYLPVAIVERATPTFSKELTDDHFPLWGQLEVAFTGVFPANTKMFDDAAILARNKWDGTPRLGVATPDDLKTLVF